MEPIASFPQEQFNRIFPFYLLIDRHDVIVSSGSSLEKILPDTTGKPFAGCFRVKRPDAGTLDRLAGHMVILESTGAKKTMMRGQIERLDGTGNLLFLGSPWYESMEQVKADHLRIDDFAWHDPLIDLLHVIKARDITAGDLKKALDTIRSQKEQLKKASEDIQGLALFTMQNSDPILRVDMTGRVLIMNPAAEKISTLRYKGKEYSAREFWCEIIPGLNPGHEKMIMRIESGDLIFSFSIVPLPGEGYCNIYGRDITEENLIQEQLMILSSIAAQNRHGVLIGDREGRIEWVNRSFETMSGYTIGELRGKEPGHILHGKDTSRETVAYLRDRIDRGEPFACEILNYRKSGEPFWARLQGQALKDREGKVIKFFSIEEDITPIRESEKALQETEARYRALIENISEVVYETDAAGTVSYISPSIERVLGYSQEEITGKNYLHFLGMDEATQAEQLRKLADDKVLVSEYHLHNKQGDMRWIRFSTKALFRDGVLAGSNGILIDITEKKLTEEHLRNSENRLSSLIRNMNEGILLEDENRRIVITNQRFVEMFGIRVSPGLLAGNDCSTWAVDSGHFFRDPEEFVKRISHILEEGKTVLAEEIELADGQFFERDFIPITLNGNLKGYLWKYTDISERKIQEQRLRQKEEKYRNIIANMKMGLMETDTGSTIEYANQQFCEMTGYSMEELLGRNAVELLVAEEFREKARLMSRATVGGITDNSEMQVRIKGGALRWWLTSGGPNFNDKGQFVGTVGISVDITERKELEEDLKAARKHAEQSSKAKEAFLTSMSHEIRTPLNAIIQLIREIGREPLSPAQNLYIQKAGLAGQHLLSIVNDILDITKIESGQLPLERQAFSLQQVVENSVSILSPSAEEKKLEVTASYSGQLAPAYMGDPARIKQILLNIINNAIKFTDSGSVNIEARVIGITGPVHHLLLKVTDTGIGMDAEFLENVFDKFAQEEISTARKYGGTGLGLTITRELVQLMDGTIRMASKKGAGTVVEIMLDLETADASAIPPAATEESYSFLQGKSILVVDDNDIGRLVAGNSLAHYGIRVTEATNGLEAIEQLRENRFDLVLMDLQMPVMDGLGATRVIRREMGLQTPIIALTANAFQSEMDQCLAAGMNAYITKPYEESAMMRTILGILEPPQVEQEAISQNLYDLEFIRQFARGNEDFVRKLIRVFIADMPPAAETLKAAVETADLKTAWETAHRMKTNIDYFCIESLKQDVRTIITLGRAGTMVPELKPLADRMESVIRAVAGEMENELK